MSPGTTDQAKVTMKTGEIGWIFSPCIALSDQWLPLIRMGNGVTDINIYTDQSAFYSLVIFFYSDHIENLVVYI